MVRLALVAPFVYRPPLSAMKKFASSRLVADRVWFAVVPVYVVWRVKLVLLSSVPTARSVAGSLAVTVARSLSVVSVVL